MLGSANQLFLKIRGSLNRCVKLVSRGNTLLRLSSAFKVGPRATAHNRLIGMGQHCDYCDWCKGKASSASASVGILQVCD